MSLSKDNRKVFYSSWLGQCSATLLIRSTQSAQNLQRWMVSLSQNCDWTIGLRDKQSARNVKDGPVYGLSCEGNQLSSLSTEYDDVSKTHRVSSALITHQGKMGDEAIARPEMVDVFWNFAASTLSFFRRTGQYQREEIITINMRLNNWDLAPFVQFQKENVQNMQPQQCRCSCGEFYSKTVNGYIRRGYNYYESNCYCGAIIAALFTTEVEQQVILCDMCTEEDQKPARKTCMKCEISMCVQHLQAHLTTPVLLQTHPLTEPMALCGTTKCPLHGKLLEYYCLDDLTCVCVSCAIEDQHRLHNMKTFSTAHKDLMEKLVAEQQALQVKTDDENVSLEKWEKSEREKVGRSSVRLIEGVTNLRDIVLTSVQSSVSARMVSIKTSKTSMQAAQNEKDNLQIPADVFSGASGCGEGQSRGSEERVAAWQRS
ncbi:hypothetical protein L3Q82_004036 [Scortum barcoo]|uniref:Uncharacterized protein n=1 Tax=Scortum barcoo TaxID=214431 RepID=A0ACB8X6R1_9TELE|nr:hypothetical protein L3Q82_004036 [Scortum barcoo]